MKPFKKSLRYWIAIASVLSFLGGWIILAHSPKPVQPTNSPTMISPPCQPCLPSRLSAAMINNNGLGFFSNNTAQTNSQSSLGMPTN